MENEGNSNASSSLFGIETYVSNHSGFCGIVKQECSDFVVNEIDINGKLIQFESTYDIIVPTSCASTKRDRSYEDQVQVAEPSDHLRMKPSVEQNRSDQSIQLTTLCRPTTSHLVDSDSLTCTLKKKAGLSEINSKLVQDSEQSHQNLPHSDGEEIAVTPRDAYKVRLQEILGEDLFEKLSVFAKSELILNRSQSMRTNKEEQTQDCVHNETFLIGVIASKEIRTEIHSHIKYLFPHLCTKVRKPSGTEDGLNITVQSDAIYWNFYKLLATNEIDDFIRFVDARDYTKTFSLSCPVGKEERTLMHRLIARHYGAFLETKTFASGPSDDKKIVVRFRQNFKQKGTGGRGQKRKAADQETVVTGFVLKKENLEMLDAINRLASALRVHPSAFSYAGIKDKKGITTQVMSVKGISSQRTKRCIDERHIPGIHISNIQCLQESLQMGQLCGNHFEIVIRDVVLKTDETCDGVEMLTKVEDEVDKAVENIKANMFLNYFGEQRFGSTSDIQGNAANIGLQILKGDYVAAVKHLLSPVQGKDDPTNKAKRFFQETQDAKTALKMMPNFKSRECMLLKALHRHGMDHEGCTKALLNIPYAMRQLYVHSYCSLVWNKMVTQRMKLFGTQLVEGDLVLPAGADRMSTRDQVQVVTEDDIKSKTFTLQDLVLPLPGNSIQCPKNKLGQLFEEYLDKDGLSKTSFRINSLKINIPGDYRKVFACPGNLVYTVYKVQDPCSDSSTVQMDSSEISLSRKTENSPHDILMNSSPEQLVQSSPTSTNTNQMVSLVATKDIRNCSKQDQISLKLTFSLPASSYATMCIRELMKE